jgi:hypothetical protein
MNHHDVLVSEGKESLKRLHANALAKLDLTYTRDDLALLLENARKGLERKSTEEIQESFDLFFELLDFHPVSFGVPEQDLQIFARPKFNGGDVPSFEHLLLFNEKNLSLGLKKAPLSPESDSDLEWVMQYVRGQKTANLEGVDVFKLLADLALDKAQSKGGQNRVTNDKYLRSEGTSFNDKELRT